MEYTETKNSCSAIVQTKDDTFAINTVTGTILSMMTGKIFSFDTKELDYIQQIEKFINEV